MLDVVRALAAEKRSLSFWAREYADVLATAATARRVIVGWLLIGAAVAHSGYAASVSVRDRRASRC